MGNRTWAPKARVFIKLQPGFMTIVMWQGVGVQMIGMMIKGKRKEGDDGFKLR